MIDRTWLHDWALACRLVTLSEFTTVNTCILTTRLGVEVLTHYGLSAKAQPVRVAAWNREGITLHLRKVPHSQWPESAWSVGIEGTGVSDRSTGAWDGHLVVVLRNPSRTRTLIDLTADQLSRPQRGIDISGPILMDLTPVWAPGDMLFTPPKEDGSVLGYEPQVNAGGWRDAPDWSGKRDLHDVLVKEVIATLDEQHPDGPS